MNSSSSCWVILFTVNDSKRNSDIDFGELIFTKMILILNLAVPQEISRCNRWEYSGLITVPQVVSDSLVLSWSTEAQ